MATTADLDPRARWLRLLRFALILLIIVGALVHVYAQIVIPPVIVFMVLFGVALFLLSRKGRTCTIGTVMGGVFAVLFLVGNLPFVIADVSHPESFFSFIASAAGIVGSFLGLVAMLGALLGWPSPAVRPLTIGGGVVIALLAVFGIVSSLGVDNDEAQEGDALLVADAVDYEPKGTNLEREQDAEISIEAGGAVFVENKDLFRHTFAIDELDMEVELASGVERRIEIDAPAGDYTFYCSVEGHEEDMRGTLTVT